MIIFKGEERRENCIQDFLFSSEFGGLRCVHCFGIKKSGFCCWDRVLSAPSAVCQTRPVDAPSLLSPEVNSVKVHNHGSNSFSLSLNIGDGWRAFHGTYLCDWTGWCSVSSSINSDVFRWPAPVYANPAPAGSSTYSYDFKITPKSPIGWAWGCPYSSAGLEIDVILYIEVTNRSVSNIYC